MALTVNGISLENKASHHTPYFTPQHQLSPGSTVKSASTTPTLFQPLQIRNVTLRNRIVVAPMCQYSTAPSGPDIGALTDYHVATLGHYALKGAALVFVEATGVQANGRISPHCPGLWDDAQVPALKRVSDFIKSQGALSGIQLAHAGRKASTNAPWVSARFKQHSSRATNEVGGWPENVVGPMGGTEAIWDCKSVEEPGSGYWPPRQMSEQDIKDLVADFAEAAQRAVKAGIDVIEIHAAHGYLINQFLSPVTNQRTDKYGGSFENRIRILVDTIKAVRAEIPAGMPLFLRMSSTEWMEDTDLGKKLGTWDVASTIKVAKLLPGLGVDLLDVSSGGNHPQQTINMFNSKDYQTKIAAQIRQASRKEGHKLLIGAVGLITEADQAKAIVELNKSLINGAIIPQATPDAAAAAASKTAREADAAVKMTSASDGDAPMADVVLVARQFMREPEWVLKVAHQLGVDVAWPNQFLRVRFPKL